MPTSVGTAPSLPHRSAVIFTFLVALGLLMETAAFMPAHGTTIQDAPSLAIRGTVTNAEGKPLTNVFVRAYQPLSGPWWLTVASVRVDEDGSYAIPVEPGTYHVGFSGDADHMSEVWDNVGEIADGKDVDVYSKDAENIDAVLALTPVFVPDPPEPEQRPVANEARPTIGAPPVIGKTLTSTDGRWSPAPTRLARQWLRNGVPIPGASSSQYRVTADDVGASLALRVTAYDGARVAAIANSDSSAPARWSSKVAAAAQRGRTKVALKIRVSSVGGRPMGRVVVTYKNRPVKVMWLKAGRATVTLDKRNKKRRYTVRYDGRATIHPSEVTVSVGPK